MDDIGYNRLAAALGSSVPNGAGVPISLVEAPVEEMPSVTESITEARQRVAVEEDDDQARIEVARNLWTIGQKDQARKEYEKLIKSPLLDAVISDLENVTADMPSDESVLRLLGDAYMKDNRLEEALAAYRRALTSL